MRAKITEKMREIGTANVFILRMLFQNSPVFIVLYIALYVLVSLIPAVLVYLTKNVVEGMLAIYNGRDSGFIWKYIVAMFSLTIIHSLSMQLTSILSDFMRVRNDKDLSTMILDKLAKLNISCFDDKDRIDEMNVATYSQFAISRAFAVYIDIISYIVKFLSLISIILMYYPAAALFYLLATVPTLVIQLKQEKKMDKYAIDSIPENRVKNYYYTLLVGKEHAKDIRLYNLFDVFKTKHNELWRSILVERERIFKKGFISLSITAAVSAVGYILFYVVLILKTFDGELSVGSLVAFTAAVLSIVGYFNSLITSLSSYIWIFVPRIFIVKKFLRWPEDNEVLGETAEADSIELTFKHVTFKYPNTENIVLDDLSFTIRSGEKLAIVGVNGAGKSTVVKLALRMYEPDNGEILLNGVNIKNFTVNSYRHLFSACFQDITKYALTLGENVALSDLSKGDDTKKIESAVYASGLDIQDKLPLGFDTPLTRMFDKEGIELSGGQWQKIAISRAYFRDVPFIILDEPSSALDPRAEAQVFNSFSALCSGKSGILISHRLSSIMMVDKIIFLENGHVKESGTHTELMELGGIYAEMYRLQAEKYVLEVKQ